MVDIETVKRIKKEAIERQQEVLKLLKILPEEIGNLQEKLQKLADIISEADKRLSDTGAKKSRGRNPTDGGVR